MKASPKHHLGWLRARAALVKQTLSLAKARKLKARFDAKDKAGFKALPKAKWTANIRWLVASSKGARVFALTPFDDLKFACLVVCPADDGKWLVHFVSPLGDPFISCEIGAALTWKKLTVPPEVQAENREEYLAMLSPAFQDELGLK